MIIHWHTLGAHQMICITQYWFTVGALPNRWFALPNKQSPVVYLYFRSKTLYIFNMCDCTLEYDKQIWISKIRRRQYNYLTYVFLDPAMPPHSGEFSHRRLIHYGTFRLQTTLQREAYHRTGHRDYKNVRHREQDISSNLYSL